MKKPGNSLFLFLLLLNAVVLGLSINPAQAHWSAMTNNSSAADLRGVWGSSPTNVYAVGANATILQYDGTSWSSVQSGGDPLNGVWGSSANGVNAVGGGGNATSYYYDGSTWYFTSYPFPTLKATWCSSATDFYSVGEMGGISHWNGATAQDMTDYGNPYTINGIWGSAPNDVWAVGEQNANIRHYNGNWTVSVYDSPTLFDVWGSSATDVFAVGAAGTIMHYDGSWGSMPSGDTADINGVWGSSATDVWAVGAQNATIRHYNGSGNWTVSVTDSPALFDIWGSSCKDIFAVGEGGAIFHYDGEVLTIAKTGTGIGRVASTPAGIDCGSVCIYHYCPGETVTLTATANTGSTFTGWSGGGCSGTGQCVLTATCGQTVSANFTAELSTTTTAAVSTTTTAGAATTTTVSVNATTTTAPVNTTTTTAAISTTTTTTKICPATQALGAGNPKLENLRAFRDSKLANSATGRKFIQLYYNNADSINAAIERSPALRTVARRMLEAIAPMVGRGR